MTRASFFQVLFGALGLTQDRHPEKYRKRRAWNPCIESQGNMFTGKVIPCAEGEEYCPSCGISQLPTEVFLQLNMASEQDTPQGRRVALEIHTCDNCGVLYRP